VDSGAVTPQRVSGSIVNMRSMGGTGLTWPPELPFEFALERARELDRSALGMMYRRFMPVVYRYVLARVGTVLTAEDITSETFFAVVDGIASMRAHDELTFAGWVLGIARNQVAMHFRRLRARKIEPESLLGEDEQPLATAQADDPLAVITARESWAETVAALNKLTEDQQTVILYRCVLGYSTDEVAELLQKQPNAIRALQFRALASLARHLGMAGEGPEQSRTAPGEGGKD
jgi:RNA polymerase sigma factor (sigma-70 family)